MRTSHSQRSRLILAATVVALSLAGCAHATPSSGAQGGSTQPSQSTTGGASQAQKAALDTYVAAAQPQIKQLETSYKKLYSKVELKASYPDAIDYEYTYLKPINAASAKTFFDKSLSQFQKTLDDSVFPEMKRAGITSSQHAIYTYYNADGSKIWTHTFAPTK